MDVFSVPSFVAVRRDTDLCTRCRGCDDSCDHDLVPSEREVVTHRDCSNCLSCVNACSTPGSLFLELRNPFGKVRA